MVHNSYRDPYIVLHTEHIAYTNMSILLWAWIGVRLYNILTGLCWCAYLDKLGESAHKRLVVLHTAGRVHQHHVDARLGRVPDCLHRDARSVFACIPFTNYTPTRLLEDKTSVEPTFHTTIDCLHLKSRMRAIRLIATLVVSKKMLCVT